MSRIIIALLLLGVLQAKAQHAGSTVEKSKQHLKWEAGANMLWLFKAKPEEHNIYLFKRNLPPYTVILKLHKNNNTAYRLRMGGFYHQHLNPTTTLSGTSGKIDSYDNTILHLFTSVGKEWQIKYEKFRFFYGGDLFVDYGYDYFERNIYHQHEFHASFRNISVGLAPLVGLQYFLHPRLSLSTETYLNVAYHQYKGVRLPGGLIDVPRAVERNNHIKVDFLPFSTLYLNYHF